MKKSIYILATTFLLMFAVHGIYTVQAQNDSGNDAMGADDGNDVMTTPCTGSNCNTGNAGDFNLNVKFKNPLGVNTIQGAIKLFVNAIVRLAIPVIVIFFIWSGLSFVFARGNPEALKKAKAMFFYTIIGTLLILGAWTITNAIIGTVNSITS